MEAAATVPKRSKRLQALAKDKDVEEPKPVARKSSSDRSTPRSGKKAQSRPAAVGDDDVMSQPKAAKRMRSRSPVRKPERTAPTSRSSSARRKSSAGSSSVRGRPRRAAKKQAAAAAAAAEGEGEGAAVAEQLEAPYTVLVEVDQIEKKEAAEGAAAAEEGKGEEKEAEGDNVNTGEERRRLLEEDGKGEAPNSAEVREAEEGLRKYWDQSFDKDDTIDRIARGEAEVQTARRSIPYFARLVGVDTAEIAKGGTGQRVKWAYKLKNPLVEAYINIGRSHDHYIYPLHVDLGTASRANIISRLHASVRFSLEKCEWQVQVFGRNGVDFPSWGWSMPAEYDDEVWQPLRSYAGNRFTIGEVEFEIIRNPRFPSDRAMAECCKNLIGVVENNAPTASGGSSKGRIGHIPYEPGLIDLHTAMESAEEDEDGKDYDINVEPYRLTRSIPSVPLEGTTGLEDDNQKVIDDDDADDLNLLSLIARYPPPSPVSHKKARRDGGEEEEDSDDLSSLVEEDSDEGEEYVDEEDENVDEEEMSSFVV